MISAIHDYIEAGFRVFGLHGVDRDGRCKCGTDCKAALKHPIQSNWQHTPDWSDEQLEALDAMGHFATGFGVLAEGFLIVDVDARNGGVESFKKLPLLHSNFVVNTGSGNGSQHLYFKLPPGVAMVQKHKDFPGIDFKTSGYVVGAGSLHISGAYYEVEHGYPQDVSDAPPALIELLRKPDTYRASVDGCAVDVTQSDIESLLQYVAPDCDYDTWIKVGMAIHHVFMGGGFELWAAWSSAGSKYPGAGKLERHWHSFGKSPLPVGLGTLIYFAKQGGYVEPVTFVYEAPPEADTLDVSGVDLLRPPGFVGELVQWINDQCRYPRERLAVGSALSAVGNLCGMRIEDARDGITANTFVFCVAGSSTGKEAVQQAYLEIMRAADVQRAVYGDIKSTKEVMRNLLRHQGAFFCIDELGLMLQKLSNASKRGGASYLEGVIALLMSSYSKANGFLPVSGDMAKEIKDELVKEISKVRNTRDDLPMDSSSAAKKAQLDAEEKRLIEALKEVDGGLKNPFVSVVGYSTPSTFNDLMDFEQATNGFMSRAMIFNELETNPKAKKGFVRRPMTDALRYQLANLFYPGCYDPDAHKRIEHIGPRHPIHTTEDAQNMLNRIQELFWERAGAHKELSGLEAIPRRGYEIVAKVSMILAAPSGLRTREHVLWAYALALADCEYKTRLAYGNDAQNRPGAESDGLAAKVLSVLSVDHAESLGVICNRLRKIEKSRVKEVLTKMEEAGMVLRDVTTHPFSGKTIEKYFAAKR